MSGDDVGPVGRGFELVTDEHFRHRDALIRRLDEDLAAASGWLALPGAGKALAEALAEAGVAGANEAPSVGARRPRRKPSGPKAHGTAPKLASCAAHDSGGGSGAQLASPRSDHYAVHVELDRRLPDHLDGDVTDALMDALADFSPAVGASERGWLSFRISVPASTLPAAVQTASALVIEATRSVGLNAEVIAVEAMTEAEFDVREGWVSE